jgi:DNA-binding response OmpR family regulator
MELKVAERTGQLNDANKELALTIERLKELQAAQNRSFANISHEFRTPLTLILGPNEQILAESQNERVNKYAGNIRQNAIHLLGLINQLLELSKLEAGRLKLQASKGNIVSLIRGITSSFESIAEQRDIKLIFYTSSDRILLYFDKDKMIKIMSNLLSNAFKYTEEGGEVTVSLSETDGSSIGIKIKDTGIGISEAELPKLFDRFYQVDSSHTRKYSGTGIGLALTRELVELHHGVIKVSSKPDEGSEFTIELPLGKDHLKEDEIIGEEAYDEDTVSKKINEQKTAIEADLFSFSDKLQMQDFPSDADLVKGDEDRMIILVVEDNADIRNFIKESLGNEFKFEEAANGEQGVRIAEKIIPDLIISDIMMPEMDGNELARRIKNEEKTSHIPIILLAARSGQESKLEGLKTGADDYLTKPFDTKELQIRVRNLINIRRKLQEKYSRTDYIPMKRSDEKKFSDLEEKFMFKVTEVIENHLSEEDFSVEQFGEELAMGRVQVYRKLKALTGLSPNKYITSKRLFVARKMIIEKKGNISEVAYSVGFGSPTYFTRCFKEEFGCLPSDLLK